MKYTMTIELETNAENEGEVRKSMYDMLNAYIEWGAQTDDVYPRLYMFRIQGVSFARPSGNQSNGKGDVK